MKKILSERLGRFVTAVQADVGKEYGATLGLIVQDEATGVTGNSVYELLPLNFESIRLNCDTHYQSGVKELLSSLSSGHSVLINVESPVSGELFNLLRGIANYGAINHFEFAGQDFNMTLKPSQRVLLTLSPEQLEKMPESFMSLCDLVFKV